MTTGPITAADLDWLAGFARSLIAGSDAAEDIAQETAMAAVRSGAKVRGPIRPWLAGVARKLAARRFRTAARRVAREQQASPPEAMADPAELVARAELAEHVVASARSLPEPFRTTILQRFLDGLPVAEIAAREGRPADTVRFRIRRGLELIRSDLTRRSGRSWSTCVVLLTPIAWSRPAASAAMVGGGALTTTTLVLSMQAKILALAAAATLLGVVMLWSWGDPPAPIQNPAVDGAAPPALASSGQPDETPVPAPERAEANEEATVAQQTRASSGPAPDTLNGVVVGPTGQPVPNALLMLVAPEESRLAELSSGPDGRFVFGDLPFGSPGVELRAIANGFLRQSVLDVLGDDRSAEPLRIVLEPGRELRIRVQDPLGNRVAGLPLLGHTVGASVAHVSPSKMGQKARKARLGPTDTGYQDSIGVTDAMGEVTLKGLPSDRVQIRCADPGWFLQGPAIAEPGEQFLLITATPCLGVRLRARTPDGNSPASGLRATFGLDVTFRDGETMPLTQWVGAGEDEVTFTLTPDLVPSIAEREIVSAVFFGKVGDGTVERDRRIPWRSEPIVAPPGGVASGVVDVLVEFPDEFPPAAGAAPQKAAPPEMVEVDLLVSFTDGAAVDGRLVVRWQALGTAQELRGKAQVTSLGGGRYRASLPVGRQQLTVAEWGASGSLPAWRGDLEVVSGTNRAFTAILQRGATVDIQRPFGWEGEWFVHASYRTDPKAEWFGSWNHSTSEPVLSLPSLKQAEWRFALTTASDPDAEPVIRTVTVTPGQQYVVN